MASNNLVNRNTGVRALIAYYYETGTHPSLIKNETIKRELVERRKTKNPQLYSL